MIPHYLFGRKSLIDSFAVNRNDPFGELGALDTILSTQDTLEDGQWLDAEMVPSVDAHIKWPRKGGIECLVLDRVQEESSVPTFINEWYLLLQSQSGIRLPLRCVRYLTHPSLEKEEKMDDEEDSGPRPVLSLIVSSSPLSGAKEAFPSPTTPDIPSTHLGATQTDHDLYHDPLKDNIHGLDVVTMNELRRRGIGERRTGKEYRYRTSPIVVLDGDDDTEYQGSLWRTLCQFKGWNERKLEERLLIYRNWFDIGVGTWIRDLGSNAGSKQHRRNHMSSRVGSPFVTSMRATRSYGFRM